jgi:hypothetical protein
MDVSIRWTSGLPKLCPVKVRSSVDLTLSSTTKEAIEYLQLGHVPSDLLLLLLSLIYSKAQSWCASMARMAQQACGIVEAAGDGD